MEGDAHGHEGSGQDLPDQENDRQEHGARLIEAAFGQARASGKDDWDSMRTAVLKNRILSLEPSFKERDWGAETFADFVDQYPQLVDVDKSARPPIAHLKGSTADGEHSAPGETARSPSGKRLRIRSDLWRAVMDMENEGAYRWEEGRVVHGDRERPGRPLPTVQPEDLKTWREEFIEGLRASSAGGLPEARLQEWHEHALSARVLPQPARGKWMAALKQKVNDRLSSWFEEEGVSPPEDLVTLETKEVALKEDTEQLRRFVTSAVDQMTRSELESLHLPVTAITRMRRP